MKLLCKIFGHKPPIYAERGWWSPGEQYGTLKGGYIDGIGRVHAEIHTECPRCGEKVMIAQVHIPQTKQFCPEFESVIKQILQNPIGTNKEKLAVLIGTNLQGELL
jgi:ribosomal protein S27AE